MIKFLVSLVLILTLTAPAPEVLATPVPYFENNIKAKFQAPLWERGAGHRGVDFAINNDDPIQAPFDSMVFFSGKVFDRNVITLISQSGLKATFEPVCSTLTEGDLVKSEQAIGIICESDPGYELHCENCVHFSIRNDYGYLNPALYFEGIAPSVLVG